MTASGEATALTLAERINALPIARIYGRLTKMTGLVLEASGCQLAVGDRCRIESRREQRCIEAEVVGFNDSVHFLMSLGNASGLQPGDRVLTLGHDMAIPVGNHFLGRVINGLAEPLDNHGSIRPDETIPLSSPPINPLHRKPITDPLDVGVRAINGLLSVGKGQRLGLMAGSGVGKSILLSMMTRNTTADITVVGMIGERGREVKEFIEHTLGPEGLARTVVIAAPADESPVMRLRAALLCHRMAEYYRDRGQDVLLLMDSLTRYAQAQREIALSVGEPPATRGYTPSVFSQIPKLVERAGNGIEGSGSITAFYTVLSEGDDLQDPVADAARSILDGHIVLSRELADSGHYPAIDIESSISRAMPQVADETQQKAAQVFRHYYSRYHQFRDMMAIGAYQRGADPELDRAIQLYPLMQGYLKQGMYERIDHASCIQQLYSLWQGGAAPAPTPGNNDTEVA
ncbi:MAG: flagellar protein export ATPase FliI [Oceanospirillales bacterium LUC14_002_19_P2]|nr:MAG: flagellar protein export ATPase FliI [Oceanospirillales bacterium LUC14_002_19_P2]